MRNRFWTLFLIVSLGLVSWGRAQTPRNDLFDLKKSQQELEIMRGILSTTLGFVVKELQGKESSSRPEVEDKYLRSSWRFSSLDAFYLYGQGAVFVIPASNLRSLLGPRAEAYGPFRAARTAYFDAESAVREAELALSGEQMALLQGQLAEMALAGVPGGVEGGVIGGVPGGVTGGVAGGVGAGIPGKARSRPGAQAPRPQSQPQAQTAQSPTPAPEAPPPGQTTPRSPDELRRKLADAQDQVIKRREVAAAKRAKFLEQLAQIKVYLIEALANHGDSLTHVKPNEYITIIITTDDGDFVFHDSPGTRSEREVLSVQRSAVTDYKAGKLTLDAFKQRVLNYYN